MPTEKGNRNLARQYIPGLIEEGYTNTEIVDILKSEGLSYRNQNMFADVNFSRLEYFGAEQIKNLSISSAIPERLMRERSLNIDYPYSAVVKYEYSDAETGLTYETGTMLYFESAPSQEDVLSAFELRQETLMSLYTNIESISSPERVYYYRNTKK